MQAPVLKIIHIKYCIKIIFYVYSHFFTIFSPLLQLILTVYRYLSTVYKHFVDKLLGFIFYSTLF